MEKERRRRVPSPFSVTVLSLLSLRLLEFLFYCNVDEIIYFVFILYIIPIL